MISLYFHFPFCTHKCPYCHFFFLPNRPKDKERFLPALLKEWELQAPLTKNRQIASIYFGGGTPTLFIAGIKAVLKGCNQACEITVEANPEDITLDRVKQLKDSGVNRISLGVQSLDSALLKHLDRSHTANQSIEAVETIQKAGIQNISIDLMYELPHQDLASWMHTVEQASTLPITHISIYNLVFEPHTLFYKNKEVLAPTLPSDTACVEMLHFACQTFEKAELKRYEISAFGRPSIHNSGYWTGRAFLGFGPSAFSYMEGRRFQNAPNLNQYIQALEKGKLPLSFEEKLPPLASLHERLAIGLRLIKGIEMEPLPPSTQEMLAELEEEGWLTYTPPRIALSEKGRLFYDTVAEKIILPA